MLDLFHGMSSGNSELDLVSPRRNVPLCAAVFSRTVDPILLTAKQ